MSLKNIRTMQITRETEYEKRANRAKEHLQPKVWDRMQRCVVTTMIHTICDTSVQRACVYVLHRTTKHFCKNENRNSAERMHSKGGEKKEKMNKFNKKGQEEGMMQVTEKSKKGSPATDTFPSDVGDQNVSVIENSCLTFTRPWPQWEKKPSSFVQVQSLPCRTNKWFHSLSFMNGHPDNKIPRVAIANLWEYWKDTTTAAPPAKMQHADSERTQNLELGITVRGVITNTQSNNCQFKVDDLKQCLMIWQASLRIDLFW